jgi:hypothetical protein
LCLYSTLNYNDHCSALHGISRCAAAATADAFGGTGGMTTKNHQQLSYKLCKVINNSRAVYVELVEEFFKSPDGSAFTLEDREIIHMVLQMPQVIYNFALFILYTYMTHEQSLFL